MKKYAYLLAAGALVATGTLSTVAPAQARDRVDFSISLGNVVLGYEDGYYDRERRWHRWENRQHRNWYSQNRRDAYFHMRRDRDRDQYRRGWWQGQRSDWRYYGDSGYGGYNSGYNGGGSDFAIVLGNVLFAYDDGYYDRDRRWHAWQHDSHRDWYRRNHSRTYYNHRRDRDNDRHRRDRREDRSDRWQF